MATEATTETTTIEPVPCPKCGPRGQVRVEAVYVGYIVTCDNCYDVDCDGDPPRFVSMSLEGVGRTREQAIADWNETVEEALS